MSFFRNGLDLQRLSGISAEVYVFLRAQYHRARKTLYFFHDALRVYRHMHWEPVSRNSNYWVVSASLLFQYHKLEKGLCIPGVKRAFGAEPALATVRIINDWKSAGFDVGDPLYLGAIATLRAYRNRLDETPLLERPEVVEIVDQMLETVSDISQDIGDPIPVEGPPEPDLLRLIQSLVISRRSVRSFCSDPVPHDVVKEAVKIAQLSPSACNRQPCRIHIFSKREDIDDMLRYQNGNRGFGHTVPMLLVLTAEAAGFFDASERNEPYVDGGLFAMTLLYAFQAQGVSTCCLNWCVSPADDRAAHERGNIPNSEVIVMYLAVGYPEKGALSPRSPRREIDSIIVFN